MRVPPPVLGAALPDMLVEMDSVFFLAMTRNFLDGSGHV
jgi:hypothetical protein